MVLWFRLVTKAMLVTQWCSSYCWTAFAACQGCLCFSFCPIMKRLGVHRSWGGSTTRQMTWTNQRNILCWIMSHSAITQRGRGFREANLLLNRNCLSIGLSTGDCLCIICFVFFLPSSTSPLLIKQFLFQPTIFLAFTLPFLFPHSGVNPQHS